jgi:hypothetical protein
MPKATQLTVSCENRPGTLAHVARVLGDAKVNIVAFSVGTSGGGDVHLVVDDVLYQELPNSAGALGYFAGKLANKEIDITSGWGTTLKGSKTAAIVLGVSDLEKATRIR